MSVYLDVLLILNVYVNYFLLKATAKFTHTKLSLARNIVASLVGSIFSFIILFPPLHPLLSLLFKAAAAAVIVLIAFGLSGKTRFIKLLFFFFAMNFIFAGLMFAVYVLMHPAFIGFNNAYFYIDFSLLTLVVSTILAYLAISLIRFFLDKRAMASEKYHVIIQNEGKTVSLKAFADTGNTLVDIFTGRPVILCDAGKLEPLIPAESKAKLLHPDIEHFQELSLEYRQLKGLRIMPFSTIHSSGLIAVFSPEQVHIQAASSNLKKRVDAKIGIANDPGNGWDAIFNPNLIL